MADRMKLFDVLPATLEPEAKIKGRYNEENISIGNPVGETMEVRKKRSLPWLPYHLHPNMQ